MNFESSPLMMFVWIVFATVSGFLEILTGFVVRLILSDAISSLIPLISARTFSFEFSVRPMSLSP